MTELTDGLIKWVGRYRERLLLLFVVMNYGALFVDIGLGHSLLPHFDWRSAIPIVFAPLGALIVFIFLWVRAGVLRSWVLRIIMALSIVVGIAGVVFHLSGHFLIRPSWMAVIYSSPLLAPLSFVLFGLVGLFAYEERLKKIAPKTLIWLTFGGMVLTTVQSTLDHMQNNFFNWGQWIPLVAGIYGGVLLAIYAICWEFKRRGLGVLMWSMLLIMVVGLAGVGFHLYACLTKGVGSLWETLIYEAPPFAPLFFADIALLAILVYLGFMENDGGIKKRKQ